MIKKLSFLVAGIYTCSLLCYSFPSFAEQTTSNTQTYIEVLPDGTQVTKTVFTKNIVQSIDEAKESLVATSEEFEYKIGELLKQHRKDEGRGAVTHSTKLADVARDFAKYLSDNNMFSHKDLNGNNAQFRLKNAGFNMSYWWGEVLAEDVSPEAAFKALVHSKDHNVIMLDNKYTIFGFGYYKGKWVGVFYYDKKGQFADKEPKKPPVKLTNSPSTNAVVPVTTSDLPKVSSPASKTLKTKKAKKKTSLKKIKATMLVGNTNSIAIDPIK